MAATAAYMLARYHRRKAESIAKLGGKCVKCGSTEDLHFDHIDPTTKSFVVGQKLASVAEHKLQTELAKCQLLCVDCHKKKHEAKHGTISGYNKCRCADCRKAKSDHSKQYKLRARG